MNNRPLTRQEVDGIKSKFRDMLFEMPSVTDRIMETCDDEETREWLLEEMSFMFFLGYVRALKVDSARR